MSIPRDWQTGIRVEPVPKTGYKSLLVREEVYQRARSHYRKKAKSGAKKRKSFSRFVNDLIEQGVESDKVFSSGNPVLKKVAVEGKSIMIKDSGSGRIVEVKVNSSNGSKMV